MDILSVRVYLGPELEGGQGNRAGLRLCPRTTCGGTEGTDSASVPHPLRKKLLNHHKQINVFLRLMHENKKR
jgi:hypothetical protein